MLKRMFNMNYNNLATTLIPIYIRKCCSGVLYSAEPRYSTFTSSGVGIL